MIAEFKEFLLKTNALALAIGVIIGAALGTVVNSLVSDIIMPPIGVLLGGVDFGALSIELKKAAGEDPGAYIRYGAFLNTVIAFVIIGFVVWRISKMFFKEEPAAPEPAMKDCPFCKESVAAAATKCKFCGSEI